LLSVSLQLLYEGASVIHGRPYPLNGQFYANVFVHFEPVGHSERHMHLRKDPQKLFEEALAKQQQQAPDRAARSDKKIDNSQGKEETPKKRPYYVPSHKNDAWEQRYVYVKKNSEHKSNVSPSKKSKMFATTGSTHTSTYTEEDHEDETDKNSVDERLFHNLAAKGMLMRMKEMVLRDPSVITKADHNGWFALHEAARAGHTRVVNYLCELMDQNEINTRTNDGKGGTPLWWALHMFNEDHPTVKALIKHGAKSIGPNEK
jgi:Ankyrin repeats (3 copies)